MLNVVPISASYTPSILDTHSEENFLRFSLRDFLLILYAAQTTRTLNTLKDSNFLLFFSFLFYFIYFF